jgi:hypothetical protein
MNQTNITSLGLENKTYDTLAWIGNNVSNNAILSDSDKIIIGVLIVVIFVLLLLSLIKKGTNED